MFLSVFGFRPSQSHVCSVDRDGDGYGAWPQPWCPHPEADCEDANPDVNPGAAEVCKALMTTATEPWMTSTPTETAFWPLRAGGADCEDANSAVNPGAFESCTMAGTCEDGLDNDCNGLADSQDPACRSWCMPGPSSTVEAQGTTE